MKTKYFCRIKSKLDKIQGNLKTSSGNKVADKVIGTSQLANT